MLVCIASYTKRTTKKKQNYYHFCGRLCQIDNCQYCFLKCIFETAISFLYVCTYMFSASFSIYQVRMKEAARENIEVARNEEPKLIIKALTEKREAVTHATITLDAAKTNARYDGFYSRTLVRHTRFSGIPALRTENFKSQMKFNL